MVVAGAGEDEVLVVESDAAPSETEIGGTAGAVWPTVAASERSPNPQSTPIVEPATPTTASASGIDRAPRTRFTGTSQRGGGRSV